MNKLINKALIALAATVLTSTAFASNWVQIPPSSYEVETQSILRRGDVISFWARVEAQVPADPASTYVFFNIKCATREIRIRTIAEYGLPKGQGEISNYSTPEWPFRPIIPGSRGDYLRLFVCGSRK